MFDCLHPAQPTGSSTSWPAHYLLEVEPGELIPGADAYGTIRKDLPVAPVLHGGRIITWAFLTSEAIHSASPRNPSAEWQSTLTNPKKWCRPTPYFCTIPPVAGSIS